MCGGVSVWGCECVGVSGENVTCVSGVYSSMNATSIRTP